MPEMRDTPSNRAPNPPLETQVTRTLRLTYSDAGGEGLPSSSCGRPYFYRFAALPDHRGATGPL